MRAFYMPYEESPEITRLAMYLGWTRNVAILERCGSNEERTWYIRAVLHFGQQIFFYLLRQLLWRTTLTAAATPFDG